MIYEHRQIEEWPGELRNPWERRGAQFKADWDATLKLLGRELDHLDAVDIVLETAHPASALRLDGTVRAGGTQPDHPGVILSFGSKFGPLRYFSDAFPLWRANVRAIALGLEHLRTLERYGISGRGEQYTGFAKLMAPKLAMTPDRAKMVIAERAGFSKTALLGADEENVAVMLRMAAKKVHPDRGGDRAQWDELLEAAEKLGLKMGGAAA
ncbi:MAG TPA: hypothetical protein VMU89_14650 [Thermomicrobiaceae bacterium]|nr:hypothetical protein [Thermomicrobiaceae bacterium]